MITFEVKIMRTGESKTYDLDSLLKIFPELNRDVLSIVNLNRILVKNSEYGRVYITKVKV